MKKPKKISNVRLGELLGISVFTLTDWNKRPDDDSRKRIYNILKSMSEDEIMERMGESNS